MPLLQVVLVDDGPGASTLSVETNDEQRGPDSFDEPATGRRPLRLGTQDLLNLAIELESAGYFLHAIDFRDSNALSPPAEIDGLISELTNDAKQGDMTRVLSLLAGPANGIHVWGIELRDRVNRNYIILGRDGVISARQQPNVTFVDTLAGFVNKRFTR